MSLKNFVSHNGATVWFHPYPKPRVGNNSKLDPGTIVIRYSNHLSEVGWVIPKISTENGAIIHSTLDINLGLIHRETGPATIYKDGQQEWYQYGKLHRTDGPAIIEENGIESWWIDDENVTEKVLELIAELALPHWREWTNNDKVLFRLRF